MRRLGPAHLGPTRRGPIQPGSIQRGPVQPGPIQPGPARLSPATGVAAKDRRAQEGERRLGRGRALPGRQAGLQRAGQRRDVGQQEFADRAAQLRPKPRVERRREVRRRGLAGDAEQQGLHRRALVADILAQAEQMRLPRAAPRARFAHARARAARKQDVDAPVVEQVPPGTCGRARGHAGVERVGVDEAKAAEPPCGLAHPEVVGRVPRIRRGQRLEP